jgi:hypothetical protein
MKTTISALLIACFFFACSDNDGLIPVVNGSDPIAGEESELLPVSFNVGFSKEIIPLRSSNSNVQLKYITYFIYNNTTNLPYKQNTIVDSDGSFNDVLHEGDYTIVFVGYNDNLSVFPYASSYATIEVRGGYEMADQFYTKINYVVEKEKENNISVALERIVGKIEIVLEDEIPSDVASIDFRIKDYYNVFWSRETGDRAASFLYSYPGSDSSEMFYYSSIEIPDSDRGAGFTFSIFSYETPHDYLSSPNFLTSIEIMALRDISFGSYESRLVATKKIENVIVTRSKNVKYTGKLFDHPDSGTDDESSSFTLSINDTWEGTDEITF